MSAPRFHTRLWIAFYVLGLIAGLLTWVLLGSTVGAFCVGANSVFLMWAVDEHLDAELARLSERLSK